MSELITHKTRTLRFYAAGGTAINLLRAYIENRPQDLTLLADEKYSYIDTSIANLTNVKAEDVYRLQGVDGSGKDRPKNAAAIVDALPDILLNHPAADFNIVIFSAAGGTGSVAGPLMLENLLKEGKNACAIVVGSHDSLKATTNTIGTLQGLEGAVGRLERPVVMHYKENDLDQPHSTNNTSLLGVMQTLSMLVSGKNAHLDSADVNNLFNYHTVTHHQPALAMLDVYGEAAPLLEASKAKRPIALAALLRTSEEVVPRINPDYDTVGYLPEGVKPAPEHSFYYVVSTTALDGVFTELNSKRDLAEKQKQVTSKPTSLLGKGVEADKKSGLVF